MKNTQKNERQDSPRAFAAGLQSRASGKLGDVWWAFMIRGVVAKKIGRETVQYVSNIYKYYIAYKLIVEQRQLKEKVKGVIIGGGFSSSHPKGLQN